MSHQLYAEMLSGGVTEATLQLALAEWKKAPAPGVSKLVEEIAAQLVPAPVEWPKDVEALQAAWLKRGRRPAATERPALLASLTQGAFDGGDSARLRARLALVSRWPPDPRTAQTLRAVLEQEARRARDGILSGVYLRPLMAALVKQGDSRTRPWLERFISHNPCRASHLRQELITLATRACERCPVVPDPPWLSTKQKHPPGPKGSSPEQLMDAVFAAPDDRSIRLVLADVLLEKNDPRGPFFALSLAETDRPLTDDEKRSREKLERRLKAQLLGELAPITRAAVFRDGFAEELVLAATWRSPPAVWKEAFSSKWMNTIHHLDGGDAYDETVDALLELAPPSIKSLTTHARALQRIGATKVGARLEGLRVSGSASKSTRGHLERFKRLRWLECAGDFDESISWLNAAAGSIERVRLTLEPWSEGSSHAAFLKGVRETIVAAAVHWFARTSIATLELNGWRFERVGREVSLTWLEQPLRVDAPCWVLAELTSAQELPVKTVTAAFAPTVLNLTPALKAALGKHLPAGTVAPRRRAHRGTPGV